MLHATGPSDGWSCGGAINDAVVDGVGKGHLVYQGHSSIYIVLMVGGRGRELNGRDAKWSMYFVADYFAIKSD